VVYVYVYMYICILHYIHTYTYTYITSVSMVLDWHTNRILLSLGVYVCICGKEVRR
jgi:hypothetical protein